jgi:hypothetical protein
MAAAHHRAEHVRRIAEVAAAPRPLVGSNGYLYNNGSKSPNRQTWYPVRVGGDKGSGGDDTSGDGDGAEGGKGGTTGRSETGAQEGDFALDKGRYNG